MRRALWSLPIAAALAIACVGTVAAQVAKRQSSSPVGGTWNSKVEETSESSGSAQMLTPEQTAAIDTVNRYFNALSNLRGRFVQIDPDQKQTRGKFYVNKPGKFRFDYAAPSRKIVVSDGRFLAIQDLDLRNEDVYQLDNTPFRILLRRDVNILRDARVLAVSQDADRIALTLTERGPDATGEITVILSLKPKPAMAGWTTRDAQGLETKITVSDLDIPEKLDSKLFLREKLFMGATQGGTQ